LKLKDDGEEYIQTMKCVYQYDGPHEPYLRLILYNILFLHSLSLNNYKKGIAWLSSIYVLKLGWHLGNKYNPFFFDNNIKWLLFVKIEYCEVLSLGMKVKSSWSLHVGRKMHSSKKYKRFQKINLEEVHKIFL